MPATGALTVAGHLPRAGQIAREQLESLGAEDIPWTFRDQAHVYRGIRLDKLLTHFGFEAGPGGSSVTPRDRRPGWRDIVVATAADGFVAVFTCAELMPEMGPTRAFVVWSRDGEPLPTDEGPLRLVVATDQKGSRSARQIVDLRVLDVRALIAAGPARR